MAKKSLAHVLIIIGAALLIIAVLLPTFLVPRLKVVPLDLTSSTNTIIQDGALLDSRLLGENKPAKGREDDPRCEEGEEPLPIHCFISDETPIQSKRWVTIEEPADSEVATLQVGTTLIRHDREEPANLINATIDRITIDRSTAWPVDEPVSTVEINAPAAGSDVAPPAFTRGGVQYQFPFDADKKTYDYFDVQSMELFQIDFLGEEEQDGTTVYKYQMVIPPQNLYENLTDHFTRDGREMTEADEASLAAFRLKFPANIWGEEGDEEIEMDRYYTNTRTVRVEPSTGMIVNGREEMFMFYAKDQEEANEIASTQGHERERAERNRTALDYVAQWDDESKARQLAKANDSRSKLLWGGTIVPIILGIIGLVMILVGIRIHRRS